MSIRKHLRHCFAFVLVACAAPAAFAQDATSGTYLLDGGSYTIQVAMDGGNLAVDEPGGKHSVYTPVGGGAYDFWNENTQTKYRITVVDARTIEASKPDQAGNAPSRLTLLGGGSEAAVEAPADSDKWEALAQKYSEMAESDPDNTQSWIACSAVALKRSMATEADADAYAAQMAGMLKQMDAAGTPCGDVIPASVW